MPLATRCTAAVHMMQSSACTMRLATLLKRMSTAVISKSGKIIDATVQFADLLGSHIYDITFNPDHLIPAGQSITDTGQYPINQLMPEQARLAQMKKEDVKATLVVSKLVFTDNSIGEYAP